MVFPITGGRGGSAKTQTDACVHGNIFLDELFPEKPLLLHTYYRYVCVPPLGLESIGSECDLQGGGILPPGVISSTRLGMIWYIMCDSFCFATHKGGQLAYRPITGDHIK